MIRGKWRAFGVAGLGLLGVLLLVETAPRTTRAIRLPDPVRLATASGMALWPWQPGGIFWTHAWFASQPFPVVTERDPGLPAGQTDLLTPGQPGVVYRTGPVSVSVLPPVAQTVIQGTAPIHQLRVNGVTYYYDRVFTAMTTAYNGSWAMNGPSGAVAAWNGQPLRPGDVAVDPSVIPLGTYLYIDGYGPARAVDTGSAIWGDHIDLFYQESDWQVALYGIQFHKVYILTQPPPHFTG
ncbi:MAG: 3D domain-containing protein [Sulfobacillus sp.]|nr:3D domain-containing protein [Sulfobacillus sp.]